jgi:succinylglutamate desuccinylase
MQKEPRPQDGDLAGAAGIQSDLEHRLNSRPPQIAQYPAHLRRQRHVERVQRLGGRVVFEFVDELARHHPEIADDLDQRLARYAALDPGVLHALGADRFPASPTRPVGGAQ